MNTKTKPKQVKCHECKHYVDEEDAKLLEVYRYIGDDKPSYTEWYCPMHQKPYEVLIKDWDDETKFYNKTKYIEVDKEGYELKN